MDLIAIANQTIPASTGKEVLKRKGGKTDDIIAEVIAAFNDSREQLNQFAPHLKAATLRQTLYNVWSFWKSNIRYKVDPKGMQLVKEPKALWYLKQGDCKSLSVAVMSTLNSLGINAAFRFTGYNGNTEFPTHVYVVVNDKGTIIPVDCVWKKFGEQKTPFSKNWDYNMPTNIYRVSGFEDAPEVGSVFQYPAAIKWLKANNKPVNKESIQDAIKTIEANRKLKHPKLFDIVKSRKQAHQCKCNEPKIGQTKIPDNDRICEGIAGLILLKNGLELEQQIHARDNGIGGTEDNAYTIQITGLHNFLAPYMGWKRKKLVTHPRPQKLHDRTHAIHKKIDSGYIITNGKTESIAHEALQAHQSAEAIEGFFGSLWKGIKSVGKAIGKGAKAVGKGVFKVIKAPITLIGKGVKAVGKLIGKALTAPARKAINEQLPGYAPFFLYTFINDPKLLSKLPAAVKIKRDKALYYRKIIVGKLGIADTTFDQVVRNGIMQSFQMTPENTIAKWIRDTNFQVGFLGAILGAAAGLLGKGLKAIVGDTGENIATDAEQYAPAVEDWGMLTEAARAEYSGQAAASSPQPLTEQQLYQQYQPQYQLAPYPTQQPSYALPQQQYPSYDTSTDSSGNSSSGEFGKTGGGDYPDTGSKLADPKTLEEVEIRRPAAAGSSDSGSGLGIALGGLFLLAVASQPKHKGKA